MMSAGSASSGPPSKSRPRRPWYLVAALLVAWLFGSEATMEGWATLTLFRNGSLDESSVSVRGNELSPQEQAVEDARRDQKLDAMFKAQKRVLPLSVASGVLGLAIWAFSVGAMAGRRGGRRLLVQVILAHGALAIVTYILTPDIRRVEVSIGHEAEKDKAAEMAASGTDPARLQQAQVIGDKVVDAAPMIGLVLSLLAHAGILAALTRKRTLIFYGEVLAEA